jgi:hypothetical protein
MILHNAAGVAMVLLALAAAQGRNSDIAGTAGQGGAGAPAAQSPIAATDGRDAASTAAVMGAMSSMDMSNRTDISNRMNMLDHASMSGMSGAAAHSAMAAHMAWSDMRPATDADRARAAKVVTELRTALAKYKDYHVAEADGFKPFHPEIPQKTYHFTRWQNGLKAAFTFDPGEPTSLLYSKTADGRYELVGAMYTAPRGTSGAKLDERVPLSVARWHRHVNLCFPPKGQGAGADWTKFGPGGSLATKAACDAAGGRFYPQVFGWMVHVYPWAPTQETAFAH